MEAPLIAKARQSRDSKTRVAQTRGDALGVIDKRRCTVKPDAVHAYPPGKSYLAEYLCHIPVRLPVLYPVQPQRRDDRDLSRDIHPVGGKGIEIAVLEIHHRADHVDYPLVNPSPDILPHSVKRLPSAAVGTPGRAVFAYRGTADCHPRLDLPHSIMHRADYGGDVPAACRCPLRRIHPAR